MTVTPARPEDRMPLPTSAGRGASEWARTHLFRTWYDTLLTLMFGVAFGGATVALIRFVGAADFTILRRNLALFMVGRFPRDQLLRPAVALILVGVFIGVMAAMTVGSAIARAAESGIPMTRSTPWAVLRRFWPLVAVAVFILTLTRTIGPAVTVLATLGAGVGIFMAAARISWRLLRRGWLLLLTLLAAIYLVLAGGGVNWNGWGGLHLNLFLTVAGILFAFPLGLLLALGRRSSLPVVRWLSVSYIELIRGVPLITLLLLGAFALGFFLPAALSPGQVIRVLIAITLFEAAYIAEVVRGGLQSVPEGQVEAAQSVGMPPWKTMRMVVLPQALRNTIPAMVGQFISLYKDTSLVTVVGMFDVLRVSTVVNTQPDFLAKGLESVTLPFAALLFWVGSYVMSREARRLEKRLGVGER